MKAAGRMAHDAARRQAVETVLVNGALAYRVGRHFHRQLAVDNATAAAYPEIVTVAGIPGGSNGTDVASCITGRSFVAQTPEMFLHDSEGNMIRDGRWTNTWDGENRLVSMETLSSLPTNIPRRRLEFTYDGQSRRVGKTVYLWSNDTWTAESDSVFVWDGWNCVAEISSANATTAVNRFTWGLDLSGTMQGAGGVGGLLVIAADGETSFPFYDGNGNIMGLVDATTGTNVAVYEYGPFGETLRSSGLRAATCNWKFSTKYADPDSGNVYYGFRYYSPGLGRWVARDVLVQPDVYCALHNDLVGETDLLGLANNGKPYDALGVEMSRKAFDYGREANLVIGERLEYCGLICCRDGKHFATEPHTSGFNRSCQPHWSVPDPRYGMYKNQQRGARGEVTCPNGSTEVAAYHSHPAQGGWSRDPKWTFRGSDEGYVNLRNESLYLCEPGYSVERMDPDPRIAAITTLKERDNVVTEALKRNRPPENPVTPVAPPSQQLNLEFIRRMEQRYRATSGSRGM